MDDICGNLPVFSDLSAHDHSAEDLPFDETSDASTSADQKPEVEQAYCKLTSAQRGFVVTSSSTDWVNSRVFIYIIASSFKLSFSAIEQLIL